MLELRSAQTLGAAARAALGVFLDRADAALRASRYQHHGEMRRAMLHLRPDGGYRALVAVDARSRQLVDAADDPALRRSLTAWHQVRSELRPVAFDVERGTARAVGDGTLLDLDPDSESETSDVAHTLAQLRARGTTHLLALPLFDLAGGVVGMITVEASCPRAAGRPFVWHDHETELELLADLVTPSLLGQPLDPPATQGADPLLPVIGARTAALVRLLAVFADQDETLLISGPTGAGKSRLARWIHARSTRHGAPFEVVDLNSVPPAMQMAELFGWRKGAFTGAVRDQDGSVARAEGGTLFLDEVDKLDLKAQSGLLGLLEDRRYRVLGDAGSARPANVRFVVGTNADLLADVQEGRFREDLYYRINVLPVRLPSLAERVDEIPDWAAFMLQRRHASAKPGRGASLGPGAAEVLAAQAWPGNLRQLDNVIRRSYSMALADPGSESEDLVVARAHVAQALGFEQGGEGPVSLLGQLAAGAAAYVAAIRDGDDPSPDLDAAGAFRGLVLRAAEQATGSREGAFELLGQENLLVNRNHHKVWKREMARLARLESMLED